MPIGGRFRALAAIAALLAGLTVSSAAQAAANYQGTWNNQTFGSSGAVDITIDLNPAAPSLVIDFDGPVFGQGNPDPLNLTGTSDGTNATFSTTGDSFFGNVTVTITGSTVNGTVAEIPNPGIDSATVDSNGLAGLTDSLIALNYAVIFPSPVNFGPPIGTIEQAVGVINADRVNEVPLPGAVWLFASALLGLGAVRRRARAR